MSKPSEKSLDELEAERVEAQNQLDKILSTSRPKNLQQGLGQGVSNIVTGAVGAAGVAVLLPTIGLTTGLRSGGLLGGVLGVTGGAVVGLLSAAAIAVTGAVYGVVQMGRGVAAVPQSILAPRQGKWWNENVGQWVLTDMTVEKKNMEGVPDDDDDILGKVQQEIDESMDFTTDGNVKDMFYYECLESPASAESSVIKRKYYLLARKYHPDKNPGDDEAAEKFKNIAEAYQVLSDPVLRKKYDKEGREGLSPDKTSVADGGAPKIDSAILFAFLFGSDRFTDYVGRLSTATSASIGDSPKISLADAKTLQKRRVTRLAIKLIEKITPWVDEAIDGKTEHADVEALWTAEAVDLSQASYGYPLITTIGKIYNLLAIMYEGSMDSGQGLPSVSKWANKNRAALDKKRESNKNQLEAMKAGIDMMKIQMEGKKRLKEAQSDEERVQIEKDLESKAVGIMLRVLWTTTVVDITSAIYETTQMVLFDLSVEKEVRQQRAQAIKHLGVLWMETPEPEGSNSEETKDVKQLYEEAAFAAMLETIKRKDEAAHRSP